MFTHILAAPLPLTDAGSLMVLPLQLLCLSPLRVRCWLAARWSCG